MGSDMSTKSEYPNQNCVNMRTHPVPHWPSGGMQQSIFSGLLKLPTQETV